MFQWRAWDNHDIRLVQYWSYDDDPRTAGSIRFTHMNSVDVDNDGHLVVSNKRVSEVTKINRDTGERLTILNDPLDQFNVQHDIRVVGENRYSVFDNHHLDSNPNSRAVEYEVDPNARTATMVWEYYGGYDSYHMGSAQRLPNGNTLINWVITGAPKVTEVQSDGTKVYEMNWSARNSKSYRVYRFPWTGVVAKPGDPDVDYYRIYGGTSSPPTTLLGTSTETLKRLYTGLENGTNYFRVTAVDIHGAQSAPSDVKSGFVNFTTIPGQNMVKNGDFSTGQDPWTWVVGGSASAEWLIEAGVSHFDITNGGTQMSDIRLFQAGMQLVQGKEYIFEFDAWSASLPRLIEAKVGQNESPWTDYSKIGPMQITPNPTYYSHSFTMDDPLDFNARVEFNLGISPFDVYLDNVSLREDLPESEGVSILLVSDAADPLTSGGNHEDDELVAWLQSLDYTVDTNGMNQNMQGDWSGNGSIQMAVAAADLILVSRRTNSGSYHYDALWNTNLEKPVILQSGYLDREERWGWNTFNDDGDAAPRTQQSMDVVAAGHPFLKGLSGSSIQIGTFNGRAMLYEMAAGTVLASGDGTLGGHRVFFVNWSYDVADADYRWDDYLTDDYKTILHNIIKEVLGLIPGDFDFDGCVGFEDLAVLVGEWPEENSGLKADLDGNGKVDFDDFAIFAENWTGCEN
ncbi:MAG: carbohydrate binding domain-containing protein [Planctomycetota bacterium]